MGPDFARRLARKTPSRSDIWHLDELVVSTAGNKHWLWPAFYHDGNVLEEIVQVRRNARAAKRLLTQLLKAGLRPPGRMIIDKSHSYGAAKRQVMPQVEHRSHKGLNNRAENSHVLLEKQNGPCTASDPEAVCNGFVSIFSALRNHFVRTDWQAGAREDDQLRHGRFRPNNDACGLGPCAKDRMRDLAREYYVGVSGASRLTYRAVPPLDVTISRLQSK